jgi:hypothetical protein
MYSDVVSGTDNLILIIGIIIFVVITVSYWKIFEKAGQPGWAVLVPIYNFYTLSDISTGQGLLCFLMFIPVVSNLLMIYLLYKLARAFGQSFLFSVSMIFLSIILLPVLAFGKAEYIGPEE